MVRKAQIEKIKIQNRQRSSIGDVKELADSIRSVGLLHPVVLRVSEDGELVLVAGERRIRALSMIYNEGHKATYCGVELSHGEVPYSLFEELSPAQAALVELEENIRRLDLSWQERVSAIERMHLIGKEINPSWSVADTAEYGRASEESVTKDLIIAKFLSEPSVASAKTKKEALKRALEEAAGDISLQLTRRKPKADRKITVGQAEEWIKSINDGTVDYIFTDPPYGIGAERMEVYGLRNHTYLDDFLAFGRILPELWRVSKPTSGIAVFITPSRAWELMKMLSDAGWEVCEHPLIWSKKIGIAPRPGIWPRRTYECIVLARRGDRTILSEFNDVLEFSPELAREHPAGNPLALSRSLARQLLVHGDFVIDPFCGSGTLLVPAFELGCSVAGCDIDEKYAAIAERRLSDATLCRG